MTEPLAPALPADIAIMSGDPVAMVKAYQVLKGVQ